MNTTINLKNKTINLIQIHTMINLIRFIQQSIRYRCIQQLVTLCCESVWFCSELGKYKAKTAQQTSYCPVLSPIY